MTLVESLAAATRVIGLGGVDAALAAAAAPLVATVGYVAARSVSLELDLRPSMFRRFGEQLEHLVVVPATRDSSTRQFVVSALGHPAPPQLARCVVAEASSDVVGVWDADSAGGPLSSPLVRRVCCVCAFVVTVARHNARSGV